MLQSAILDTKRHEIQNCVASRKRKLSELYHVAATVGPTVSAWPPSDRDASAPTELQKFTEAEFLDANDILRGRYFDIATLARVPRRRADSTNSATQTATPAQQLQNGTENDGTRQKIGSLQDGSSARPRVEHFATPGRIKQEVAHEGAPLTAPGRLAGQKRPGQELDSTPGTKAAKVERENGEIVMKDASPQPNGLSSSPLSHNSRPSTATSIKKDAGTDTEESTTQKSSFGDAKALRNGHAVQEISSNVERPRAGDGERKSQPAVAEVGQGTQTIASRRQDSVAAQNAKESPREATPVKPPMRIDTSAGRNPAYEDSPLTANPKSAGPTMQSSPPERMRTRVSSGAIRHKSVSEILGETPKSAPPHDQGSFDNRADHSLSQPGSAISPESATIKSRSADIKDHRKTAVVFARQQNGDRSEQDPSGQLVRKEKSDMEKDYLVPLFVAQASASTPSLSELIKNAHKTLTTDNHYLEFRESHDCKILKRIYHLQNSNRWSLRQYQRSPEPPRPTTHWDNLLGEMKWLRTDFREERKWKFAAARNMAEWCAQWICSSELLRESMQTAESKNATQTYDQKEGVTYRQAGPLAAKVFLENDNADATPELIHLADDEASDIQEDELPQLDVSQGIAPAALFSLPPEDVSFPFDRTPAAEKLLDELPLYQPFDDQHGDKRPIGETLDAEWQTPMIPVSKFTFGKIVPKVTGAAHTRSKFDYTKEDEDTSGRGLFVPRPNKALLPPEQQDVALFDPKNKHIINRLHAAHAFRPPSEFSMPAQSFFEARNASLWTQAEDDELRRLVREYEYNWSLISASLSSRSLYSSGPERRTPWECFERWESFEGLPGDMDKHSYFRAWKARRQNARDHLERLWQNAQNNGSAQANLRKRSTEPVQVERRRNSKHLALIQGMQRIAKKREQALQKQQQVASLAAMRKAAEPPQQRLRMQTPQEFSAHKHKQECEFKEKTLMYRQQLAASQRAALSHKAAQQAGAQQAGSGISHARVGLPSSVGSSNPQLASSLPQNATQANGRPLPPSQAMLNGVLSNGPHPNGQMGIRGGMGLTPAQMQSYLQSQQQRLQQGQGGSGDSARVMMEASRLQEQQRLMQQRQFQGQGGSGANGANNAGINGLPSSTGSAAQASILTTQMQQQLLANLQNNGTKLTPQQAQQRAAAQVAALANGTGASGAGAAQQLSSGVVPIYSQITNQLRVANPNLSPEQIKRMATQQLHQRFTAHNAAAAAAAGNSANRGAAAGAGAGGNSAANAALQQHLSQQAGAMAGLTAAQQTQVYAQYLRQQQQHQQQQQHNRAAAAAAAAGGANNNSNASTAAAAAAAAASAAAGGANGSSAGSDTNGVRPNSSGSQAQQKPGSSGGQSAGSNQSPRPPQAQVAGGS